MIWQSAARAKNDFCRPAFAGAVRASDPGTGAGGSDGCEIDLPDCANEVFNCRNEKVICLSEIFLCRNEKVACRNEIVVCRNEKVVCRNEIVGCRNGIVACLDDLSACLNERSVCRNRRSRRENGLGSWAEGVERTMDRSFARKRKAIGRGGRLRRGRSSAGSWGTGTKCPRFRRIRTGTGSSRSVSARSVSAAFP